MVEAGADEVPEDVLLEALDLAHAEIRKLCEAQEDLRRQAGKAKWLDTELTAELESSHGHAIWERLQGTGLREGAAIVEELQDELAPELSMDSTDEDITRRMQVRASLAMLLEKQRLAAVEGPVREQFGADLRALTEAEQDSKELKSAKRHLLFDRIVESVELPFPVGPATVDGDGPAVKDSLTKSYVKKAAEAIYKDLVRKKIAVEKRRPDGRGTEEIRPIECEVTVSPRTHGRPLHARPDADHDAAARSARRRRASGSTTSRSRPTAASCTTTTSRPTRSGRPASCEARSGATSATARSRSGRSRR